ncbi:MAG: hypothetical protein ABFR33_07965 [Verrucomicrobiota bacterium]
MKKELFVVGMLAVVGGVRAGVVAGWDVAGVDVADGTGLETNIPPYTFMATTGETASVSARLTLGGGVNPSTSVNQYGFKISIGDGTNSLAGAIASNHYMEFLLTVASGYELNLDSIEMKGGASSSGCSNVVLMTSIDGFTAGQEIASAYPANEGTGGLDTDSSGFGAPIDLSAAKYQNLAGSVSFRLYGWDSTSGSGSTFIRSLADEDLVVNGTIVELSGGVVPELAINVSNGTVSVSAAFDGASGTNFVLQSCNNLVSNDWNTVSAPFTTNTTWDVEATNSASFYRAIAD